MTLHAFSPDSIESEQVLLVCTALKGLMSSHGWNRRAWFLRPPACPHYMYMETMALIIMPPASTQSIYQYNFIATWALSYLL